MDIGDIIRATAKRDLNKTGVVFGKTRLTWSEVNSRVNALANGLLRLGLSKGDRVAILSRACNQYFEFNFACAKAGLVQVALNHWSLGKELIHPIADSEAKALFVNSEFTDRMNGVLPQTPSVSHLIGIGNGHSYPQDFEEIVRNNSPEEPGVRVETEDLYCLCYTSGTTGKPKGVMFDHRSVLAGSYTLALASDIESADRFLMIIPFCFASHGASRFHAVLRGATCVIQNFEPEDALRAIETEEISYMHIGPTALRMLLDNPHRTQYRLDSLRKVWITGGALSADLWEASEKVLGPVVAPTLGMTENLSCGSWFDRAEVVKVAPDRIDRLRESVGKACPGVQIRVVDSAGCDVKRDGVEVGELLVRSDAMMKGYWRLPEKTATVLENGWLRTEDLVSIDQEGHIFFRDRNREMIKSGGMMIFPLEIESILQSHPAVLHAAVVGVPHLKWGETPKAFVVLRPGIKATCDELMELCKQNLASYKKPSYIEIVDSLPFTVSGKVKKAELRSISNQGLASTPER